MRDLLHTVAAREAPTRRADGRGSDSHEAHRPGRWRGEPLQRANTARRGTWGLIVAVPQRSGDSNTNCRPRKKRNVREYDGLKRKAVMDRRVLRGSPPVRRRGKYARAVRLSPDPAHPTWAKPRHLSPRMPSLIAEPLPGCATSVPSVPHTVLSIENHADRPVLNAPSGYLLDK
jgi:hypothetical protein